MSTGSKIYARNFIGNRKETLKYIYVPSGELIIVGFTDRPDVSALSFRADQGLPPPKIQLNAHNAPAGMQWLTTAVPLGGWAAFKWTTPSRMIETLVAKAALRTDLLPGDLSSLDRRVVVMRVMAATEESSKNVEPVVGDVGYQYATDGIKLAKWLSHKLGGKRAAAWLEKRHPTIAGSNEYDTPAMIDGSGYEDREWYDLRQILLGAYRFTHLGVRRQR